ncbi:hypothetical protein TELCIR_11228 [Teladorsagia circumcincta]|uniref:SH2 domain-containing protein n=1 Tax=Teladorsagia circumcincta TaxID=45464 RepID=A0A2G9U9V4_TELCI|nr:hypothetical protein TELCIR_11228 [Teladorsagia circumcincta]
MPCHRNSRIADRPLADKTQPREIIVSVLYDPDGKIKTTDQNGKLEATRNLVVQTAMSNKSRKYFFDSREKFDSIEDLLTHHSETPLVVNQVCAKNMSPTLTRVWHDHVIERE